MTYFITVVIKKIICYISNRFLVHILNMRLKFFNVISDNNQPTLSPHENDSPKFQKQKSFQ